MEVKAKLRKPPSCAVA